MELKEGERRCSVLFSGDVGNAGRPLLRNAVPPPRTNVVVMETTYGSRLYKPLRLSPWNARKSCFITCARTLSRAS